MPQLILGVTLFTALAVLLEVFGGRLLVRLQGRVPLDWGTEYIALPLLRVLLLVGFLLWSYPALFGWVEAAPLEAVFDADEHRLRQLVNLLFVLSLLLPLLPLLGELDATVLPLQGLVATALLYRWATDAATPAATPALWPALPVLAALLLSAAAIHYLARAAAAVAPQHLPSRLQTLPPSCRYRALALASQWLPMVLYGRYLGGQ